MPEQGLDAKPAVRYRYADFGLVRRLGPTVDERVRGSARLRAWRAVGVALSAALADVCFEGMDRVPETGPVLLAVNHSSFLDGPLLFGRLPRPVSFLVKAEAFAPGRGVIGRVLIAGAQIPVRRHQIDPAPVRLVLAVLRSGGVIGIFPEGTRGDGTVRQALPGVGYLALKTGATVVPVAVHGSASMSRRRTLARPEVTVSIGQPQHFPAAPAAVPLNRGHWLAVTETIRRHLAELVDATAPATLPGPQRAEATTKAQ